MRKKQQLLICFLLCMCPCILSSCTNKTENKEPQAEMAMVEEEHLSESSADMPENEAIARLDFTKEDFLADYDYMWEVLEENYLFFDILEERGIDVESLKKDTRQQIAERDIDLDDFIAVLEKLFQRMQCFAHLGLLQTDAYDVMYEYYCNVMAEDEFMRAWRTPLENPQTQAVYAYMKEEETDSQTVKEEWLPQGAYDSERKAVIFQIPTFEHMFIERDKDFFIDYLESLEGAEIKHIIFDITGNGGGSDYYWKENIIAPFGGSYECVFYLYLKDTPLSREYFLEGQTEALPIADLPTDHMLPAFAENLGLTHFIAVQWQESNDAIFKKEILEAKRWVLVDGKVYSAADTFCAFCKETGWASVVGERTLGDGIGYAPIMETLPNTGLLIRFSDVAGESDEGLLNAAVGTAPDYYTDIRKFEDPLTACKRLIDAETGAKAVP